MIINYDKDSEVNFREEQKFWWKWWFASAPLVFAVLFFIYIMYEQLILGQPWGNKPMSDAGLKILGTSMILVLSGITYLLMFRLVPKPRPEKAKISFYS